MDEGTVDEGTADEGTADEGTVERETVGFNIMCFGGISLTVCLFSKTLT